MSMVICDHCERLVDSDDDPDCFFENPYNTHRLAVLLILCEPCREREWERQQQRAAEDAP